MHARHALRRLAALLITLAALATAVVSVGAVASNAATGPHNTYAYSHSASATSWTTTQTWHQYQTSTTYNEEQVSDHGTSTGAGYHHYLVKYDRAGKWTQLVTGWSRTAKGAVTYLHNATHN